jgi:hypothetical protein
MIRRSKLFLAGCAGALLSGCMTTPAKLGTTYECDRGTRLQVSYLREGALVRVNGGLAMPFKQTPSNAGEVYESGANRLARNGNTVTWNTAARTAPETCRAVNTIN